VKRQRPHILRRQKPDEKAQRDLIKIGRVKVEVNKRIKLTFGVTTGVFVQRGG